MRSSRDAALKAGTEIFYILFLISSTHRSGAATQQLKIESISAPLHSLHKKDEASRIYLLI
jgi:hypothetical protein